MKKSTMVLLASMILILPFIFLILGAIGTGYCGSTLSNLIQSRD